MSPGVELHPHKGGKPKSEMQWTQMGAATPGVTCIFQDTGQRGFLGNMGAFRL